MRRAVALLAQAAFAGLALGGGTERWEIVGPALAEGEADGLAVTPDGRLGLAPRTLRAAEPAESTLWSVAIAADGWVAAGGGETGRVYLAPPGGEASVLHAAGEGEVFAVVFDGAGRVTAAWSPGGSVLRMERAGGEPNVVFDPGEEYVWDLLVEPDGGTVVATGGPGRVYRVTPAGKVRLLHDSGREHVRALALDPAGRVIVGTSGRATVVRLEGDRGFVLHDAGDGEVTDIALDPGDGAIWVAIARPAARAGRDEEGDEATGPGEGEARKDARDRPLGGVVLRIEPDGLAREVAVLDKETPLALAALQPDEVLVGTADRGRILVVDRRGRTGVRLDTASRQVHALAAAGGRLAIALSNVAGLLTAESEPSRSGTLLSPVRDAARPARWGRLRVEGDAPRGARVAVHLRGGNTAMPDAGWTDWTALEGDVLSADGAAASLPPTRFAQWRVTLEHGRDAGPTVRSVAVRYQPANRPPRIQSFSVEPAGLAYRALPPARASSGEVPVLVDPVPRDVEQQLDGGPRDQSRPKKAYEPGVRSAVWKAEDPDDDRLLFDLLVTSVAEDRWLPLAQDLEGLFHSFDTRALPDGRYRLRLVARDVRDNDPLRARRDEATSDLFLVDNRPPEVVSARAEVSGPEGLTVTFVGRDATGPVVRGEISVGGGPWRAVFPEDGVGDSREERFLATIGPLPDASAFVRVRVMDEAGNIGTAPAEPR